MWIETPPGGSCNTTAPPPPPPPSSFPSYRSCATTLPSCQVVHDRKLMDTFQVQTGVRQGCLLSPTIFLLVVDWILKQATSNKKTGIQLTCDEASSLFRGGKERLMPLDYLSVAGLESGLSSDWPRNKGN